MPNGKRCVKIDDNKVKGLLVGINYRGTSNELGGCINDVKAIERLIRFTYPKAKLEILTDDTVEKPTRDNILTKLKKLVDEASAGDLLIFDYSGHGSQVPDIHGDEADGLDETICPIDFMKTRTITYQGRTYVVDNQITNDEINEIITNVPKDAKFLMLSDSCHSGTIGDLKNDFLRYDGPSVWPNIENANNSTTKPITGDNTQVAVANTQNVFPTVKPSPIELELGFTVTICKASWIYLEKEGTPQIWLTPQRYEMFEKFNYKKHIINMNIDHVPNLLQKYRNRMFSCKTIFKQLSKDEFLISAPELEIEDLKINLSRELTEYNVCSRNINLSFDSLVSSSFNSQNQCMPRLVKLPDGEEIITTCNIGSHYDPDTGRHEHINYTTGEKNTLKMRSHNCCHGGELRIISGCQEHQTSADTGRNGACTLAFLDTVRKLGSLENLLKKVFSHNVQDLKFVQDYINSFLMKHGFTQQSMVSWDHSTATRSLYLHFNDYLQTLHQPRLALETSNDDQFERENVSKYKLQIG